MPLFGFMVMRQLTEEQQAELDALLARFGDTSVQMPPVEVPASMPLPGDVANLMQGNVTWGDVAVEWRDGVPQKAWRVSNPGNWAYVPARYWSLVMALTPRDEWLAWVYLAFPESSYVEDAHNGAGEDSWGVLQVNRDAWPEYGVAELSTYEGNLRAAIRIKALQGWGAWWNSAHLVGLL